LIDNQLRDTLNKLKASQKKAWKTNGITVIIFLFTSRELIIAGFIFFRFSHKYFENTVFSRLFISTW